MGLLEELHIIEENATPEPHPAPFTRTIAAITDHMPELRVIDVYVQCGDLSLLELLRNLEELSILSSELRRNIEYTSFDHLPKLTSLQ